MVKQLYPGRYRAAGSGTRSLSAASLNALRVRRVERTFSGNPSILNPSAGKRKNLGSGPTIFGRSFGPQTPLRRHQIAGRLNDEVAAAGDEHRCNNDALWVQPANECYVDHRHRRATFA